jgi:hypothetical protein
MLTEDEIFYAGILINLHIKFVGLGKIFELESYGNIDNAAVFFAQLAYARYVFGKLMRLHS